MLIHHDPDEFKSVGTSKTCPFHKQFPGKTYAGCTCSSSFGLERRPPDEIRALKAKRRREEENEILAQAEIIRARRVNLPKDPSDAQ